MDLDTLAVQTDRFTPKSLLNVIVKGMGLYWFSSGLMNGTEVLYAMYLDRFTASEAVADQQMVTWGVIMVAVGAWMVAYSSWITKVSFALDAPGPSRETTEEQV